MAEIAPICYTAPMLRRTTFHAGPVADTLGTLAAYWGLRPAAGPGSGQAAILRLALRVAARSLPPVQIPPDLQRPDEGGPRQTIFLDAADDAAIETLCETYNLKSTAAACRVALWLLAQYGLSIVPAETQKSITAGGY